MSLLLPLVGVAFATNVPMFGGPARAPLPAAHAPGRVLIFVATGPAPAALPRLDPPTASDLPPGPRPVALPPGSPAWRARVEVERPGRFVPVDAIEPVGARRFVPVEALESAFEPVPLATSALPRD